MYPTLSPKLLDLVFKCIIQIMKEIWIIEFNRNSVLTFINDKAVLGDYQEKVNATTEETNWSWRENGIDDC